jgi:hypothetical protein
VEIKAIDPPKSVVDAMEKQMRAEREKRAAVLNAEGQRQSKILTAEGEKQSAILRAEGEKQSQILRADGQAQAIETVFKSIHDADPDPKVLAYQYLQTLPQLAQGQGSTFWVIPSEVTSALKSLSSAFDGSAGEKMASAVSGLAGGGPAGERGGPAEEQGEVAGGQNAAGAIGERSAAGLPAPETGAPGLPAASQTGVPAIDQLAAARELPAVPLPPPNGGVPVTHPDDDDLGLPG